MKVIRYRRYGGPEVLEHVEIPDPVPGPGEVLIDVRCASVIPGDWKVRAGHLQDMFPLDLPTIPGRDGAGVVAALGPGTDWARVGDELCFVTEHTEPGSYAERVVRPRAMTVPKPAAIGFPEAAAMMHAGVCAWIGLVETAGIAAGQSVLVHGGAGAIGGMAVQIAKHFGCTVAATCRAANADHVRGLGADRAIAYDEEAFERVIAGVDVVFDLVGGDLHARSCTVLRPGGTLVWLIAEPFEDVSAAHGVLCRQARIHDRRETLERVARLVADGAVRPQVSARLPLARAADAHRLLERGGNSRGRVVLDMDGATT